MAANSNRIRRLLVANRGEIAIRVFRAASELDIATVAIYSNEDRFALHRFKADESYLVGEGRPPVQAYLDIESVLRVAANANVDAIHPGYGFLSENPDFADAVRAAGMLFVGPNSDAMRKLGNKVSAREIAIASGVQVIPASALLARDDAEALAQVEAVGYPVMLKASWGGGGRGMRVVQSASECLAQLELARKEAAAAFGNDEVYAERYIARARHIEVQIVGDAHGNIVHLGERDCSVQRRHQKVIEEAPARGLDPAIRDQILTAALAIGKTTAYDNAGTVEFLFDIDKGSYHFIEVNPRIQVEHTVTEVVTGIDLVHAQIRIAEGYAIGTDTVGVPFQDGIRLSGHAMQCRITTEDADDNFRPTYGRITAYRPASGFGVRLDGSAYAGAVITPYYDSLLEKVTVWAPEFRETRARMLRALREFRVRGVATNVAFLDGLLSNSDFIEGRITTAFLDRSLATLKRPVHRDRATRLLNFVAETIVNGNPEVRGRKRPDVIEREPKLPPRTMYFAPGTRELLASLGPTEFASWMREQQRVLVTDTTMRDAHQSLLATRVRSRDILRIAPAYAELLPNLFSLECWGGATFDVALRFLNEDPWDRLAALREAVPNIMLQMLIRGANAVGYTTYPDNVVQHFVERAARAGVDVFRVFDSLNWVENMRVSIDAVVASGKLCEGALCYTGDILDPQRTKYDLNYYVELARELEATGIHILGIKDMAGLLKPEAARRLVTALKEAVSLPIHFHTHDTSGNSGASVIAAIEAGVDAVDGAIDAMSGLTSQPNLGSIAAALRNTRRDPQLDAAGIDEISRYWEAVRRLYRPFESEMRAGSSDVYQHEMPGGQYTNLREQATSLGVGARWPEVTKAYADVNALFGDIVKVTPSSKVVGDMAIMMVSNNITAADVADPAVPVSFPQSVVELFSGHLGQPKGGFPRLLQAKILNNIEPITVRPGSLLPPADLAGQRAEVEAQLEHEISDDDFASYLMYPNVFVQFDAHRAKYGDVSVLPTSVFFYGLEVGQEIEIELERGKILFVRFAALGEPDLNGMRTVYFELNGQSRSIAVADALITANRPQVRKAEKGNGHHVGAPMPGQIVAISVADGGKVEAGDPLVTIEAMKMQTVINAPVDGVVHVVEAFKGKEVDAGDLLFEIAPAPKAAP